jgi:hypothetical protein
MKTLITHGFTRRWLGAAMSLLAALATQASTSVTFTVDMSPTGLTPTTVLIKGTFNNWGSPDSPALTNNGANVWSQTVTIADPPGTVEQCKFVYDGNWETINNREFLLGSGTQVLPQTTWNVSDWPTPTNAEEVTFQVDLTAQTLGGTFIPGQTVAVAGDFESSIPGSANWDNSLILTNDPNASGLATNIYSGTWDFSVVSFPPVWINYKFRANGGWESPSSTGGNNRSAQMTNFPQVLPLVYYDDLAPNAPTNWVTFQVDMSAQILAGAFLPGQSITVSGGFEGSIPGSANWDNTLALTNNPALPDLTSNIYLGTFPVVGYRPVGIQYKFRANSGWESPTSTGGNNRTASITSSNQILPLVYYSDTSIYDLLATNIWVTFSVNMAGASQYPSGPAFNPPPGGSDTVFLNSPAFNSGTWLSWDPISLGSYQLIQVGSSMIFTNTFLVPMGGSVSVAYKYGINAADNEAASGSNHDRVIRTTATGAYAFPTDTFGNQYNEPAFGQLAVGPAPGNTVQLSWLGAPNVQVQTRTDLTSGAWVSHLETSGQVWSAGTNSTNGLISVTNWPAGSGNLFFRLQQQ